MEESRIHVAKDGPAFPLRWRVELSIPEGTWSRAAALSVAPGILCVEMFQECLEKQDPRKNPRHAGDYMSCLASSGIILEEPKEGS